jgi:hypothetical protein
VRMQVSQTQANQFPPAWARSVRGDMNHPASLPTMNAKHPSCGIDALHERGVVRVAAASLGP